MLKCVLCSKSVFVITEKSSSLSLVSEEIIIVEEIVALFTIAMASLLHSLDQRFDEENCCRELCPPVKLLALQARSDECFDVVYC